jgi:hypothetical protein
VEEVRTLENLRLISNKPFKEDEKSSYLKLRKGEFT